MHKKIILITGCAGFIGYSISRKLLLENILENYLIIGIDNLNTYYDVNLKKTRLAILKKFNNFIFYQLDLKNQQDILGLAKLHPEINFILHLAAQAGVRYSLTNPFAYTDSNITGFLSILELARNLKNLEHLVYASSSSVYGNNQKLPFSIQDRVDTPISLYAATKKSSELMGHCYSHLFKIKITGLRFFTVYGPWGRPDMALFLFTKAILENKPIQVFNFGEMMRDFTYVSDIVEGVVRVIDNPPIANPDLDSNDIDPSKSKAPYKIYNIGNSSPVKLMDFITAIERALGMEAKKDLLPIQPGDVPATYADTTALEVELGYKPNTSIEYGIGEFVKWYRLFYQN